MLKKVLTDSLSLKRYLFLFTALFVFISFIYGYLLINSATGIIDFGAYYIEFDVISTLVISSLISLVITLNAYSFSIKSKTSKKLTIGSIIGAVLPSSLCCTSIIPSIMAIAGFSTSFILGNTGKIQSVFSIYSPVFIGGGAIIAFLGLMQITKNINSSCSIKTKNIEAYCCEVKNESKD
ncbi:MAG: hypothetical protein M1284_01410 [Candidatus Parvarchaeota archaeon]|jgi:hypothetical protein|nr:hypothetical protein [Candidatus Parvarchaeota archaeon]MCL5420392.1 hypothetical protein [Candidatus Parvarchaeota archaeon]